MRRIALPSVWRRKSASFQPHKASSVGSLRVSRASKSGSVARCAYLFHGQISWQSSQP